MNASKQISSRLHLIPSVTTFLTLFISQHATLLSQYTTTLHTTNILTRRLDLLTPHYHHIAIQHKTPHYTTTLTSKQTLTPQPILQSHRSPTLLQRNHRDQTYTYATLPSHCSPTLLYHATTETTLTYATLLSHCSAAPHPTLQTPRQHLLHNPHILGIFTAGSNLYDHAPDR